MTADRDRRKRIVYTETPGHVDIHIKIHNSAHMITNPDLSRFMYKFHLLRPQIGIRAKSKSLHAAGVSL